MTLIIAIKGKDYVIVGSDSRSVTGEAYTNTRFITDIDTKLVQLNKYVCVMVAGDSQRGTHLINKFKETVKSDEDVCLIVNNLSLFCQRDALRLVDFVSTESPYYPNVSFIVAGMKKIKEKYSSPKIYTIRSLMGYAIGEDDNHIIIGKDTISNYLFAKKYSKEITWENSIKLIVKCLVDTELIDGDVGGEKKVILINKDGFKLQDVTDIETEIKNADITKIIEE